MHTRFQITFTQIPAQFSQPIEQIRPDTGTTDLRLEINKLLELKTINVCLPKKGQFVSYSFSRQTG